MTKKRIKSELSYVFGSEPVCAAIQITDEKYSLFLVDRLNWFGRYGGADSPATRRTFHKQWLSEWALKNGFKKGTFTVPNEGISTSAALARMSLRGFPITKEHVQFLKDTLANWIPKKAIKIDYAANARLLSIKAKLQNENEMQEVLTVFDTAIDKVTMGAKKWSVKIGRINVKQAKELTTLYKRDLKQLQEAYNKEDEELVTAYPYSRIVMQHLVAIHEEILDEIKYAKLLGSVVRKARKKKVKPASTLIKKLKYLPVHKEYGIVSVDAESIIGSLSMYVFDTKKRLLKYFQSPGTAGIEVSGTTLGNCICVQKKIRNPLEQLKPFTNKPVTSAAAKKTMKVFADIKAVEKDCTGRMNANTIILKVFK